VFHINYLLIKIKLNNNGANMPKPIQFKKLLLLMLLFSSSTNVFSQQTIKNYIDNQWQDSRYTKHYTSENEGTVTDTKTGLMWKQCPEGLSGKSCSGTAVKSSYEKAILIARLTDFADYQDWRLPNMKELASLVAHDRYRPAINSTFFPNTPDSDFWSSSPYAYYAGYAWMLDFGDGYDSYSSRNYDRYVRLVRGGE
jgi:hypothetical protein